MTSTPVLWYKMTLVFVPMVPPLLLPAVSDGDPELALSPTLPSAQPVPPADGTIPETNEKAPSLQGC
ncbi:hypothetical protein ACFX2I_041989 [Malus domestica]